MREGMELCSDSYIRDAFVSTQLQTTEKTKKQMLATVSKKENS
jgi:hypothetical protein